MSSSEFCIRFPVGYVSARVVLRWRSGWVTNGGTQNCSHYRPVADSDSSDSVGTNFRTSVDSDCYGIGERPSPNHKGWRTGGGSHGNDTDSDGASLAGPQPLEKRCAIRASASPMRWTSTPTVRQCPIGTFDIRDTLQFRRQLATPAPTVHHDQQRLIQQESCLWFQKTDSHHSLLQIADPSSLPKK